MCTVLYLATAMPIARGAVGPLTIGSVADDVLAKLRDKLTLPHVCAVLAGTCSCAIPNTIDGPQDYEPWMAEFDDPDQRPTEVETLRALLDLVRDCLAASALVEIHVVWENDESHSIQHRFDLSIGAQRPEVLMFTERGYYAFCDRDPTRTN